MTGLCHSCKQIVEIVHVDADEREYCASCTADLPVPPVARAMAFLAATTPFRVGDRVECRLGGQLFEGVGRIDDISFSLEHGGSPVYPAFHVVLEEKGYPEAPNDEWATEVGLRRVDPDQPKRV